MLMDLIIAFVPYLSYDSLCILFELVKRLLEVQKYDIIFVILLCTVMCEALYVQHVTWC